MNDADLGVWAPLSPREAASLLRGMKAPWWIAGGHAIELFVGRALREHGDLDVGVLRRDQLAVREHLGEWDLRALFGGTLRPWPLGERLRDDVNDVWCRPDPESPWRLQLHLNRSEGDRWVFRRDRRVSRPLVEVILWTREGLPYLAPEVQLLFKAKDPRPKDERDLEAALPLLSQGRRSWLDLTISETHPDHPWLLRLRRSAAHRGERP